MTDPLLEARLEALEAQVDLAAENEWLRGLPWNVRMRQEVWTGLNGSIGIQAQRLKQAIHEIRASLEEPASGDGDDGEANARLRKAWGDYSDIYRRCQELFGEFLEFIGGLTFREAFRDRREDHTIYSIADEIVRRCSDVTIGGTWQSITVPARQEALRTTLARIIRLRYPEQSIWTLPFTAHEFGHVVMALKETGFPEFVREQAAGWVKGRSKLGKEAAELHAGELAADAFATYYMGPAYGFTAIHLKLELLASEGPTSQSPAGSRRGYVILKVLELMNQTKGGDTYRGLSEDLTSLTAAWDQAARAAGDGGLKDAERKQLDKFADAIHGEKFRYELLASAQYPSGAPGWLTAQTLHDHWKTELQSEAADLTSPETTLNGQPTDMRDVLNAAWITRLSLKQDPKLMRASSKKLEKAALELCERIIDKQGEGATTQTVLRPGG